jgi:transposase
MRRIKELLRLSAAGLSYRQMAGATGLSLGSISRYLKAAQDAGLSWPMASELTEADLGVRLVGSGIEPGRARSGFVEPDYAAIHQGLKHKGVTLLLLWEEYRTGYGPAAYGYTQFCVRYRNWVAALARSMRQVHRAGEKLFVDYAGPTVPIIDGRTGEMHKAQIFVAVLGASNYTYVEATRTQQMADWIGAHARAFTFFGGVSEIVVPDNPKVGVNRACRYEPELNRSYQEMAAHYGVAIIPARPYKPRDKAKVEVGVQIVERWILARLRHRQFFSLGELNSAIRELRDVLNDRPFKKLAGNRHTAFAQIDAPALRPLPATAYEFAEWKIARVHIDYHVEIDHHYYSVPHALVKRAVDTRFTATTVECFHGGQRVASHPRSHRRGGHTTLPEHMPKAHQRHAQWSPERLLGWALDIGPSTHALVRHQLETKPHPEMGYRACLGLLSSARRYGRDRLEAACRKALAAGSPTRGSVISILKTGLDRQVERDLAVSPLPDHANVRGPGYYH